MQWAPLFPRGKAHRAGQLFPCLLPRGPGPLPLHPREECPAAVLTHGTGRPGGRAEEDGWETGGWAKSPRPRWGDSWGQGAAHHPSLGRPGTPSRVGPGPCSPPLPGTCTSGRARGQGRGGQSPSGAWAPAGAWAALAFVRPHRRRGPSPSPVWCEFPGRAAELTCRNSSAPESLTVAAAMSPAGFVLGTNDPRGRMSRKEDGLFWDLVPPAGAAAGDCETAVRHAHACSVNSCLGQAARRHLAGWTQEDTGQPPGPQAPASARPRGRGPQAGQEAAAGGGASVSTSPRW